MRYICCCHCCRAVPCDACLQSLRFKTPSNVTLMGVPTPSELVWKTDLLLCASKIAMARISGLTAVGSQRTGHQSLHMETLS